MKQVVNRSRAGHFGNWTKSLIRRKWVRESDFKSSTDRSMADGMPKKKKLGIAVRLEG